MRGKPACSPSDLAARLYFFQSATRALMSPRFSAAHRSAVPYEPPESGRVGCLGTGFRRVVGVGAQPRVDLYIGTE